MRFAQTTHHELSIFRVTTGHKRPQPVWSCVVSRGWLGDKRVRGASYNQGHRCCSFCAGRTTGRQPQGSPPHERLYEPSTSHAHYSNEANGLASVHPPSREASIPLDILVSACGIEQDIVANSSTIEILPGLSLPVASLGHLIAMKVLSQNSFERLQDRVDLLALLRSANQQDRNMVERSLKEIANRGFSEGRNLVAELHEIEAGKGF